MRARDMAGPTISVFFDARVVRPGMTGVGRYALGLLRGLAELPEAERPAVRALALSDCVDELRRDPPLAPIQWIATDIDYESHPKGDWGLRFAIPRMVGAEEIYHGPAFILPGGRQRFARVVSIHDVGVFASRGDFPRAFAWHLRGCIRRATAAADRIIVPSRAIAEELAAILDVRAEGISVIPHARARGIDAWGAPSAETATAPESPYFISVATLEPRKGPLTALEALERLLAARGRGRGAPSWLWIGGAGFKGASIERAIGASPAADRFHRLGFSEDASVERLLAGAAALVFPSRYEGFGLPPLEAMASGVPVVASDLPVLRELCGEAALYAPPGDAEALAATLGRLLDDPASARRLAELGRERARAYSWRRTAMATIEAYRAALETRRARG
jgi:alpha-1,3-rhamnosyl/mannosyltransferase